MVKHNMSYSATRSNVMYLSCHPKLDTECNHIKIKHKQIALLLLFLKCSKRKPGCNGVKVVLGKIKSSLAWACPEANIME